MKDLTFIAIDIGKEVLEILGSRVLLARSGKEAIELYRKNRDKIDIVIMDMIMRGIGGRETYDKMKEINPDVKASFQADIAQTVRQLEYRRGVAMVLFRSPLI